MAADNKSNIAADTGSLTRSCSFKLSHGSGAGAFSGRSGLTSAEDFQPLSSRFVLSSDDFSNSNKQITMSEEIRRLIPSIKNHFCRWDCGRICIVGGSKTKTGPPFYAGQAALQCGADVVTILTTSSAATPVKCFSSAITVLPYLPERNDKQFGDFMALVWPLVKDHHAFCVGPGLGKDKVTMEAVKKLILKARESNIAVVINSGALPILNKELDLLSAKLWEAPVVVILDDSEFDSFWVTLHTSGVMSFREKDKKAIPVSACEDISKCPFAEEFSITEFPEAVPFHQTSNVGNALGQNVVLVRTGLIDLTVHYDKCFLFGGLQFKYRCRGQGDLLAGLTAMFLSWQKLKKSKEKPIIAARGAVFVIRLAALDAFRESTIGVFVTDVADAIPEVIKNIEALTTHASSFSCISNGTTTGDYVL